jgi:TRAP-type mannitol/chloroaromatic compound transport system permease large subunit
MSHFRNSNVVNIPIMIYQRRFKNSIWSLINPSFVNDWFMTLQGGSRSFLHRSNLLIVFPPFFHQQ